MAENEGGQEQGQGGDGENGFKPITSPAELDAFLKDRVARAERKATEKFADYDDLKSKAAQLDQLEQASKTEAQKTADRIADLEKALNSTKTEALRSRIQARFKIADEDAELFLTATDEATLVKQAQRLAERAEDRKKNGNRAPLQGRTSTNSGGSPLRDLAHQVFKPAD